MNTILILGAEGGLGQAFGEVYKDQQPVALDREDLDITNQEQVTETILKLNPKLVINCAAFTNVDKAESERDVAENINGYAPGFIAAACKGIGATLVHFSTGQVFDGKSNSGYNEDDLAHPVNVYGRSKLLGEMEVRKNLDNFYIIRSVWLFGRTKSGKKSFIDIMTELAEKGDSISCVEDEFGTPTYDLDLAQAARALIETEKPFGIYHLTNVGRTSRFDWAQEIFRIKKIDAKLSSVKAAEYPVRPAARPKYELLNNTKFIALRPWTEALEEFLNS
jgi:dTDP-4-dehydrorhamnose reductase